MLNLKEFLLKQLKFFPFLLQQDEKVYIYTESLYPFLRSKDRNEVYILQNLLSESLWEFNFDNSRIYFSQEYLDQYLSVSENTFYFQDFQVLQDLKVDEIHQFKNFGFLVSNSFVNSGGNLIKFKDYHQRIIEYKSLQEKLKGNHSNVLDDSGYIVKFKNVHAKTNFRILNKLFSLISPVNFVFLDKCNTKGTVGFKSETGKKLALEYFKREFVWQKDGSDLGTLLTASDTDASCKRIVLEDVDQKSLDRKRKASSLKEDVDFVNLIAVIGPTGVGKSKLAIELAHRFKGEIVNADSMQVYKGLDIITNKVSREEMAGIRHCLMDYVDPFKDAFTVQDWTSNALKEIQDIQDRGKVAILVGGTHYYLQSILTLQLITVESAATHQVNQVSQEIMGNLKEILDKSRLEPNEYAQELSDLLRIIDPIMGNRWHPRDGRKIRRSLEVFYTTGMRQSDIISKQKLDVKQRYRTCIVWPFVEKEALEKRLDDRIEEMIDMGLVKEIQDFYDKVKENGFEMDFTRGIFQAIGFKEFQEYFRTNDPKDFKTGVELMKLHTRQYAKSQVKWIKNKLIGRLKDQISFISLDLTDLNAWEENSLKVSEKVEEFLKGKDVQVVPHSYLVDYEPLNTNIIEWKQFKCEICTDRITKMPRIFNGEHEWKSHLDSRIHRRNAQKKIGYKNNRLLCDAR